MAEETPPPADEPLLTPAPGVSDPDRLKHGRDALVDAALPKQVGPYHVLELVGIGGMGEVYKAERRHPIRQTVAIKVIKLGLNSREVIARFDSERQALARMDHPNVARALDAGVTDSGQPYFVMEYVPGVPITKFADDNKLSIKRRLELFCQACEAINHAHTKAIIHRDIKAANVLAYMHDDKPTVKVIDFGIAKALTGDRLTDATFNTEQGRIIGTYASMSPEQAEGSPDIDTRTDVYSLGVLLYELLTGAKPFDQDTLARAADNELKRIIREVEPPRPSTRLSSLGAAATKVANLRDMHPDQLERDLRRELEWIPLKAMRKERARRYASALQLAEDIGNYLRGQPLIAGPETRTYRLQKYVTRHRTAVLTATAVLLLVGLGIALYIRGIRAEQARTASEKSRAENALAEARKQESEAIRQSEISDATNEFLSGMLASADPDKLLGNKVTVLQAIQAAVKELDSGKLKNQPQTEAAVRTTIGNTLRALGEFDAARPNLQAALDIRRETLVAGQPEIAASLTNLGLLLREQGKLQDAEPLFREAMQIWSTARPARPSDVAGSMNNLAGLLQKQGKFDQAEPLFRNALELRRKVLPAGDPLIATDLNNLAALLKDQGKLTEAETLFRQSLDIYRKALPAGHPQIAQSMNNLALILHMEGKLDQALPLYRDALEMYRKALPAGHPNIAMSLNNLGGLLQAQGKALEAEQAYRESLEIYRRALPADHPQIARVLGNLGSALEDQAKFDQAEPLYRESLEIYRKALPAEHPDTATALNQLAIVLYAQGRVAAAEPLCREALEIRRQVLPPENPSIAQSLSTLAELLRAQGKRDEAETLLRQALGIYRKGLPAGHPEIARCLNNLTRLLYEQGKLAEAEVLARESLEISRKGLPADHPGLAPSLTNLAALLQAQGKFDEAEQLDREALSINRKAFPGPHPQVAISLNNLAALKRDQGKLSEAETLYREALEVYRKSLPAGHTDIAQSMNNLALLLKAEGKLDEAEQLMREALQINRKALPAGHPQIMSNVYSLAVLLQNEGKTDEALPFFEEGYSLAASAKMSPKNAALTVSGYGLCLVKLGKYEEALEPLRAAYERMNSAGLEKDPRMRDVAAALADACEHTNRASEASKWRMQLARLQAATQPNTQPTTQPTVESR